MKPDIEAEIKALQKQAEGIIKGLRLEWRIQRAGEDDLKLEYKVLHGGETALYLLDRVIGFAWNEGFEEVSDAILVLPKDGEPETLRLVRGYIPPPRSFVSHELMPGARRLEPGGTLRGNARIPLPLRAWHPNDGDLPLESSPNRLELRIGLLPTFCELQELPLTDGSAVPVPNRADAYLYQQWLASEPRPIPG